MKEVKVCVLALCFECLCVCECMGGARGRREGGVEGYFSETAVIQSVFSLSLARMRTALFIVYVLPVLIVVAQATPGETTLHLSSFLGGTW